MVRCGAQAAGELTTSPARVLEDLEVPRDRVLYVQSSADWIQHAGLDAAGTLSALIEWVGTAGTLVMPSYPFNTTHLEYLESAPVYDVRRTPAAIGLLPEMFRRTRQAVRSLDPDFCVTALGMEAEAIVGRAPGGADPFGAESAYQRMLDRRTVLVGLGVSTNTNSFIHVIDSRSQDRYPSPVYVDRPFTATVIDGAGRSTCVARLALRPEFQRLTTPSSVASLMRPPADVFTKSEVNGAVFFKWDLERWAAWCFEHAAALGPSSRWPCWLTRLGDEAR
jgi:aminoglycoside N3'-acetyltransferase